MKFTKKGAILLTSLGLIGGMAGTIAAQTHAASTTTTDTTTAVTTQTAPQFDKTKGGHVGSNGTAEVLLTGDTASKVTAAALAAQPGATIDRVETDAEGATYEAHMTKSDGTQVTLKFDTSFNVTGTESGGAMGGSRQSRTPASAIQ